jgi:hypothetical protein
MTVHSTSSPTVTRKFGNWYSGNDWDGYSMTFRTEVNRKSEIYWFTDAELLLPPRYTLSIMILNGYANCSESFRLHSCADAWTTTCSIRVTTGIRINFINSTESCGVIEWRVWPINYDSYDYVDVETHTFQDYMRYIPVPYNQTLIMSNLKQNSGW